jgi:cell division transport system permease protein
MFLSLLIIVNAVRISIYTHREEIRIMRLVGASNRFIRWPFFLEGVLYSLIAVLISLGLVMPALHFFDPYLAQFFQNMIPLQSYFSRALVPIFGGQFLALSLLNIIAAWLAMGRYLKV